MEEACKAGDLVIIIIVEKKESSKVSMGGVVENVLYYSLLCYSSIVVCHLCIGFVTKKMKKNEKWKYFLIIKKKDPSLYVTIINVEKFVYSLR